MEHHKAPEDSSSSVTEITGIERHLLVDGTTRIFHLLGEIDAKLDQAMKQAAQLRGMLEVNDDAQSGANNTLGAGA